MNLFGVVLMAAAITAGSPSTAQRIAIDAAAIERIADLSKKDLPVPLLQRMVTEDIELMRGLRPDGTYENATWERLESGRTTESFSVNSGGEVMQTFQAKGTFVYRVLLEVPERRMLVRKNVPVWIERVDVEYLGDGPQLQKTSIEIKSWLQPAEFRPVDLPVVARQATVTVAANADPKGTYGNLEIALIQARIIDNPDSPFAGSVTGAKAALKALSDNDVTALREAAGRMRAGVGGAASTGTGPTAGQGSAPDAPTRAELEQIEDLLTGTDAERRDGLDRLHQLIRRLRER